MGTRTARRAGLVAGVLSGTLLLLPLAGCGDGSDTADTGTAATETTEDTGGATETSAGGSATASGTGGADADLSCSGTTCRLQLSGPGRQAEVLGVTVELGAVEGGQAMLRVGDRELSCAQGDSVSAGPLQLTCETVAEDSVTLTASLG
ncbi:hypothetical protein ACI798_18715 [Geodermatophilus sp. SYSU D01045]